MKFRTVLVTVGLVFAAPVPAFAGPGDTQSDVQQDAVDELHIEGFDGAPTRSSLSFEIAPAIAAHNSLGPVGPESRDTTSLDTSLMFINVQPIGDKLEVRFLAGPDLIIENGDVREAVLVAGAELRTRPGASGIVGFVGYEFAEVYEDFFKSSIDTENIFSAGIRYGTNIGPGEIGFELGPRWLISDHAPSEYLAGRLLADSTYPLVKDKVSLIGEFSVDRRWYLSEHPLIGAKRRDWRLQAFAGVDFADLLAPPSGGRNPVRSLGVGVLWQDIDSNRPDVHRTAFKFVPAITVGASF